MSEPDAGRPPVPGADHLPDAVHVPEVPQERHEPQADPVEAAVTESNEVPGTSDTPREPDMAKIEALGGWLERWKQAEPAERAAMREEGITLARARREEFKALIVTNPKSALEKAVPRVVRQDLPAEIVAELEQPVSATGDLNVYQGRPAPGKPLPAEGLTLRYFEGQGVSYQARVFGALEPLMTSKQIPIRGVAIDRELAVAESPVRQLEVGERIPAGRVVEDVCPVSGKTSEAVASGDPVTEDTPTIEVGEKVITLCNGSHVTVMDEKYRVLVQAAGSGSSFFMDGHPGTSSGAIGNLRCLYIRATYPDQLTAPNTEDEALADMKDNARFFLESSFGKLTSTYTVTPLITLPYTLKWYQAKDKELNGLGLLQTHSRDEARKIGYDSTQYDCIILRVNGGLRDGSSWGGGDSVWLGWGGMDIINHEVGHSLGVSHANYWNTTDGTPYGNGSNQEYGNDYDVMGGAYGFAAHYRSPAKRQLRWLPDTYVHFPKTNGVYRLHAFDQPQLEEGKRYAINVAKNSSISYDIEYHGSNPTVANQALVLYGGRLIDTTQGSNGGKRDAGIQLGRTYSDPESDQHFTLLSINATQPPSIDLAYHRGPFPGNVAPTASLAANTTSVVVGGSVTFTATANDSNGDPLAYSWQFSDGVTGTNSAVFTRTFTSTAHVTALLTVSDMKGGTVRRSVTVTVGSPVTKTISGTITDGVSPLAGVLIKEGSNYCYSSSDGTYTVPNVGTGSNRTLSASLAGYSFTPSFANPMTVSANVTGANWTGAASTFVTLTKTADATEGGFNGNFRITRTGDTANALAVSVAALGGTAVKTTDYTLAPDVSSNTFTIPAGSATLDVAVAAVNDTAQEGPETITLQVVSGVGYWAGAANAAVMALNDNDTTLPQVAVTSPDPYAIESTNHGNFTFTRTGSTAASLDLSVAWTGTATNGSDYQTLAATITIPSGQASVNVPVTALDDSAAETPEDIIAIINSNAAYVRDIAATTATVSMSDDDTPYVSVSVPDDSASESGPDSGVFLIHRTGSTAAALKVYYGLSGTAAHGTDFVQLNGEVTIPAGATSAPVVITPYDDTVSEVMENVTLAVATYNNAYSLGADFQGSVTIGDNVDIPVISVRAATVGTEGGSNASMIFHSSGSAAGNVTVNYTVSGTATSGSDFTALSGSVTVPASGPADVTVTIPVIDDALAEPTESVVVKITQGAGYQILNDGSAIVMIRDNDSGGERVAVSAYNNAAAEGGADGKFYFTRTGTTGDLSVNYTLTGTATNGADYATLTGTCVIPNGASAVDVFVTPVNDTTGEGIETVVATVVAGTGYSADMPSSATVELIDNDTTPVTVGFQSMVSTTTEMPGATGLYRDYVVALSAAAANTVSVSCVGGSGATASGDDIDWVFVDPDNGNGVIASPTLVFAPGVTSKNVRIRVKNDGFIEPTETVVLELRAPNGASLTANRNKHTVWISDSERPAFVTEERWNGGSVYTDQTWSSNTPYYSGYLSGFTTAQDVGDNYSRRVIGQIIAPTTGTYKFWVASDDDSRLYLSTDSTAANKVQIASLSGATGFQNWDANATQASGNISLVAGQSYYMEAQQQEGGGGDHLSVAWQGPGFSRKPITIEPPADMAPRFVRLAVASSSVTEADGTDPRLMVMLDRPAGNTPVTVDYTVSGTATAGSDYTLSPGTLTFAVGEQMKLLPLSLIADAIGEAPEAIVISLANPSGAEITVPSTHVINVRDADTPVVETLITTATSAMSAGTVVGTATATPASGRTISGWVIVAGNSGNAFAINAAGQVSLAMPGALPNPGGVQLVVRATDNVGSTGDGLVNIICNAPANGVVEQRWNGSSAYFGESWSGATPAYTGTLPTFTTAQDVGEDYSRRLTGYLKPAVSGDYTFWIAGDDDCRLYLGSNGSPFSKTQIASVEGWSNFQEWDKMAKQKSVVIPLVAGKVYWFEANHLEGGGGDHVSVAWQGPGISRQPIPSSVIFPNAVGVDFENPPVPPTIAVTSPSAGAQLAGGSNVTLTATVVGGTQTVTTVEFYRGSTLIASDNAEPFSVTWSNVPAGDHTLTARAFYSGGSVTSGGVAVSVSGSNYAPSFTADPVVKSAATEDAAYSESLAGNATDPNGGDMLAFSKVSGPAWLNVAGNGALSGSPSNDEVGTNSFMVRVTDSAGASSTATLIITVTNVNDAPVFTSNPIIGPGATAGAAYSGSLAVAASDMDAGDTLTYAKVNGPTWLGIAANGTLSGTPGMSDAGTNSFTVSVTDAGGLSSQATLDITVTVSYGNGVWANAAGGTWQSAGNWSGGIIASGVDKTANFATLNLTADAAVTLDGATTVGGLAFADTTASHNWTLNTGSGGALTLAVSSGTPTISVTNQTATIGAVLAGSQGLQKTGGAVLTLSGANTYTGISTLGGGTLAITNASALPGALNFSATSGITFRVANNSAVTVPNDLVLPTPSSAQTYNVVKYTAGASSGTQLDLTGTISGGNANATLFLNSNIGGDSTTSYRLAGTNTFVGSVTINRGSLVVTSNASLGASGNSLTLNTNNNTTLGALRFENAMTFTHPIDMTSSAALNTNANTVTMTGAISGTAVMSKIGSGVLNLDAVNPRSGATTVSKGTLNVNGTLADGVVTVQSSATLGGNGSIGGTVSVLSGGTLAPTGTLTVNNTLTLAGTTQMELGKTGTMLSGDKVGGITTVTFGGNLIVTHLGPDPLAMGDNFQLFSATSYSGSFANISLPTLTGSLRWDTSQLSVTGTIRVTSMAPAPVAVADSATVTEDGSVSIAVLANDTDGDNDIIAIQSVTQGAHGTVAITGNNVTYTPAANWNGTDSFNYTVTDNQDGTSSTAVSVTVSAVNDAPVWVSGTLAKADATVRITYSESLVGDASDGDAGDTLTYSKVSGPSWLDVASNGSLSGTPLSADTGLNTFVMRVIDDSGASSDATLNITVAPINNSGVWINPAGGSWFVGGNWSGGTIAGGVGQTADFSTLDITSSPIVSLDDTFSLGTLKFGDTSASHDWILASGSGGPLTLAVTTDTPVIQVNNQTTTINAALSGTQGFLKTGAGTLALSGANTYTGVTRVTEGTVNIVGDASAATGGWSLSPGAAVNFLAGSSVSVASGSSVDLLNGTAASKDLTVDGGVVNNGSLIIRARSNMNIDSGGNWTQIGNMTAGPLSSVYDARLYVKTGGAFTYAGTSDIAVNASTQTGNGSGEVNLDGGTFTTNKGFTNASTGTGTSSAAYLNFTSGGMLKLSANIDTLATTVGRPFNVQFGTGGGIVDTNGFSTTITQGITGSGGLTKRGGGVLTLSGSNSFTGATTLDGGKLDLTGSLGSTAVEVKSSAALVLGGNAGSSVTVRANGHLAIALAANAGSQVSRSIGGQLAFDSGSVLDLTAVNTPQSGDYILATAQSINGTPGTVIAPPGVTASVVVVGNTLHVNISAVSPPVAADDDGDGLQNGVEYVFGTDSEATNATAIQTQRVGGNLVFTFPRSDASETMGLQVTVEAGDDLQSWPQVFQIGATTGPGVTISENGDAPDTVTVAIPTNGSTRKFARLKVTTANP